MCFSKMKLKVPYFMYSINYQNEFAFLHSITILPSLMLTSCSPDSIAHNADPSI